MKQARVLSVSCVVWAAAAALTAAEPPAIPAYIRAPDSTYSWKAEKSVDLGNVKATWIHLNSQTWRGILWHHWIAVLRPETVRHPEHALLVISGGSRRDAPPSRIPREAFFLGQVAARTGTVIAVLGQVPNQPLFDGLKEDALIAYTFQKFLETGDETWPCLLPMVKSAIRAMDCVEEYLKREHDQEVRRFTVTGASKRGWTTWLTGALDERVAAIAPMVIDTLNMPLQMPHQIKCWGAYSEQIKDYTRLRLPERLGEPGARRLIELVDPYSYRKRLKLPKLILIGTNDRYWPVDAIRFYFDGLPGEKYITYVPNAGHGLGDGRSAIASISAFYHTVVTGAPRPRFRWERERREGKAVLRIFAEDRPEKVELWSAHSSDRDFRDERWEASPIDGKDGKYTASIDLPGEGYTAYYAALAYRSGLGHPYTLSTTVEVLEPPVAAGK